MRIERVGVGEATGHVLVHNVVDGAGKKRVAKGTLLAAGHLDTLRALGFSQVEVATLEPGDIREDEAARRIAAALLGGDRHLEATRAVGGRVNLHATRAGVLHVDEPRLAALNALPGVTLATRPQHAVATPDERRVATLKIIPYAIPEAVVTRARDSAAGLLRIDPLRPQRVALLVTAEPAAAGRLTRQFEGPTRARLRRLGASLDAVESVTPDEEAIAAAARRLLDSYDALVVAGQTSIMDAADVTPRALEAAGARVALHGAPVEPGNLLALAYRGEQWIMGAPGCARSPSTNVVDLVLPRLLAGERLGPDAVAALGLGGLL